MNALVEPAELRRTTQSFVRPLLFVAALGVVVAWGSGREPIGPADGGALPGHAAQAADKYPPQQPPAAPRRFR
ncbi:MAG TPA: hypothetical protein VG713_15540, partial [Pirellulales bacterium]|nr:hypothetical protein [Pirellulales bacterium]